MGFRGFGWVSEEESRTIMVGVVFVVKLDPSGALSIIFPLLDSIWKENRQSLLVRNIDSR